MRGGNGPGRLEADSEGTGLACHRAHMGLCVTPLAPRLPCPLPLGVPTTHRACPGALTRV
jgi:hypothetical protein